MISLARTNRSAVAEWWWTVDRTSLAAALALAGAGLVFLLAASPAIAGKLDLDPFYFFYRQISFIAPAAALMVVVSMLSLREVRRLALGVFLTGIALMAAAIGLGPEIKGAHRWLQFGVLSLQPSEFVKPAFVVLAAWTISESRNTGKWLGAAATLVLFALFAGLLVLQPDYGQTLLISAVLTAMLFMAGVPVLWLGTLGGLALGGAALAYLFVPHVGERVAAFLDPAGHDTFQTDQALDAFAHGGFFGVGPGLGQVKFLVPDAHTDYIFAIVGEEFGAVTCLALASVFALIVLRGFLRTRAAGEGFAPLAGAGLIAMIGLQAFINMAVNLNLIPAKGMTLPFVSYGGSSMLAVALAMGMALSLTRKRPQARRVWRAA